MGCGCNKAKSSVVSSAASARSSSSSSVVEFDVVDRNGSIIASYESVVLARSDARRIGGTVVPTTRVVAGGTTAEVTEMSVPAGEQTN